MESTSYHAFPSYVSTPSFPFSVPQRDRGWRTFKRPGVEAFLERMAQFYEVVLFTDQLNFVRDALSRSINRFRVGLMCSQMQDYVIKRMEGGHVGGLSEAHWRSFTRSFVEWQAIATEGM